MPETVRTECTLTDEVSRTQQPSQDPAASSSDTDSTPKTKPGLGEDLVGPPGAKTSDTDSGSGTKTGVGED